MITQNLYVNADKKGIIPVVHMVQGDTGRKLTCIVLDYDIPSGSSATLSVQRPDGNVYSTAATISNDNVSAMITSTMLEVVGIAKGTMRITSSGSVVSTFEFMIKVEEAAGAGIEPSPADGNVYVYINGEKVKVVTDPDLEAVKSELSESITEISSTVYGSSPEPTPITPVEINDYYINKTGAKTTWAGATKMTENIALNKGDTITMYGAGIAQISAISLYDRDSDKYTPVRIYEGTSPSYQTFTYTAENNCVVVCSSRSGATWGSLQLTITSGQSGDGLVGKVDKLIGIVEKQVLYKIITVGVGKDFESFNDAIESITASSETCRYIVEVYEGEYETVVPSLITTGYKGLFIPDYVSIIGKGDRDKIIIKGTLPDSSYSSYANNISTLNFMKNGSIENVTIKATNLRYCIHDDGQNTEIYEHTYKDCVFVYDALTISGVSKTNVGIGNESGKNLVFERCRFINPNISGVAIFMHDNAAASQKQGANLVVRNCIFSLGTDGHDVSLSNSGGNIECNAVIENNALSLGIIVTSSSASITTNKWKVLVCGNKNYSLTQKQGMIGVDLSNDIIAF